MKANPAEARESVISDLNRMIRLTNPVTGDSSQDRVLRTIAQNPTSEFNVDISVVHQALQWTKLHLDTLDQAENRKRTNWLAYKIAKAVQLPVEQRLASLPVDSKGRRIRSDVVRAEVYKEYFGKSIPLFYTVIGGGYTYNTFL